MELATITPRVRRKAQFVFVGAANAGALALLTAGAVSLWRTSSFEVPQGSGAPEAEAELDMKGLANSGVFGTSRGGDPNTDASLADLGLTLRGVIAAKEGGLAFISVNGSAAEFFAVGQEILDGTILEDLHDDHAVVRRGAETRTVTLTGPRVMMKTENDASEDPVAQ